MVTVLINLYRMGLEQVARCAQGLGVTCASAGIFVLTILLRVAAFAVCVSHAHSLAVLFVLVCVVMRGAFGYELAEHGDGGVGSPIQLNGYVSPTAVESSPTTGYDSSTVEPPQTTAGYDSPTEYRGAAANPRL